MRVETALGLCLAVAVGAFVLTPSVEDIEAVSVGSLPDAIDAYRGVDALFCQSDQCAQVVEVEAGSEAQDACPVCGSALDVLSPGERGALPGDTVLMRKKYNREGFPPLFVSVVVSGASQRSIHRPQQCLPALGNTIESQRVIEVPREGDEPLRVMTLGVRRQNRAFDGSVHESRHVFGYWFTSIDGETPYHLTRLARMGLNRVLRGRNHRWAYVAVLTDAPFGDTAAAEAHLRDFVARLYPRITPRG